MTVLLEQPAGLTFAEDDGLVLTFHRLQKTKSEPDGKRLRNLCAALCNDVAAHASHELPAARSARYRSGGPRLFRLAGPRAGPRHFGRYRLQRRRSATPRPQAHAEPGRRAGTVRRQG